MEDWYADAPPIKAPTTDEMDKTTPEERYKLVALCAECSEWHHFTGSKDRFLQLTGEVCKCGSKRFIGDSLVSERTWDPRRKFAKKKR